MNTVHIRTALNGRRVLRVGTVAIALVATCAVGQANASSHTRGHHHHATAVAAAATADPVVTSVSVDTTVSGYVVEGNDAPAVSFASFAAAPVVDEPAPVVYSVSATMTVSGYVIDGIDG